MKLQNVAGIRYLLMLGEFHRWICSLAVVGDGSVSLRSESASLAFVLEPRLRPPSDGGRLLDMFSTFCFAPISPSSMGSITAVELPPFCRAIAAFTSMGSRMGKCQVRVW